MLVVGLGDDGVHEMYGGLRQVCAGGGRYRAMMGSTYDMHGGLLRRQVCAAGGGDRAMMGSMRCIVH